MKSMSILFMDGLYSVAGVKSYNLKSSVVVDSEAASVESDGTAEVGAEKGSFTREYTRIGNVILDIFKTIDAINALDMYRHSRVGNQYDVEEYQVLNALKVFIRPSRAIVTVNAKNNIRMVDFLEPYVSFCSENEGTVLSPEEFSMAQLKILRVLNPKCVMLSDVGKCVRSTQTLTENDYLVMPVTIDGKHCSVSKPDSFKPFGLSLKVYSEDEYIYEYSDASVRYWMEKIALNVVSAANGRGVSSESESKKESV